MSTGVTTVLYDPSMSTKGAVLTAGRAPKREKDPEDYAVTGEIYNPNALRMYRVSPQFASIRRLEYIVIYVRIYAYSYVY